jgi:shikimate dehydrogenase
MLVLGAGRSARAIGFGLQEKGATVILANRSFAKGQALAGDLNCECYINRTVTEWRMR